MKMRAIATKATVMTTMIDTNGGVAVPMNRKREVEGIAVQFAV